MKSAVQLGKQRYSGKMDHYVFFESRDYKPEVYENTVRGFTSPIYRTRSINTALVIKDRRMRGGSLRHPS